MREYVKFAFQYYSHTAASPISLGSLPNTVKITTMRLQDEFDALRDRCSENTSAHIRRVRQEAIDDLIS